MQAIITFESSPTEQKGKLVHKEFRTNIHHGESLHAAYFDAAKDQHALIQAAEYVSALGATVVSVKGEFLKSNSIPRTVQLTYLRQDTINPQSHIADQALTGFFSAIPAIIRASFPVRAPSDYGVTITPNIIESIGSKYVSWLDIRAMINDEGEIENILHQILEKHLSSFAITTRCSGHYIYTSENALLVQATRSVLEQNGLSQRLLERGGATDGRHFARPGVQVIDLGPIGGNLHGSNEWVDKHSLLTLIKLYQDLPRALDREITKKRKE